MRGTVRYYACSCTFVCSHNYPVRYFTSVAQREFMGSVASMFVDVFKPQVWSTHGCGPCMAPSELNTRS